MKKIVLLAISLVISLSTFAQQRIDLQAIRTGMTQKEFFTATHLEDCTVIGNTLTFDCDFGALGCGSLTAFFDQDYLAVVSVRLNTEGPLTFKAFEAKFDYVVSQLSTRYPNGKEPSSTAFFAPPFMKGDGCELYALYTGNYQRHACVAGGGEMAIVNHNSHGDICVRIERLKYDYSGDANVAAAPTPVVDQTPAPIAPTPTKPNGGSMSIMPDTSDSAPDSAALNFAGCTAQSSALEFAETLSREAGFEVISTDNPDQVHLRGTFMDIENCDIYLCNTSGLLSRIIVYYPERSDWKTLRAEYFKLVSEYRFIYKFKRGGDAQQRFEGDYDGKEMEGVRADCCYYITPLKKDKHKLTVYISKYARVSAVFDITLPETPQN